MRRPNRLRSFDDADGQYGLRDLIQLASGVAERLAPLLAEMREAAEVCRLLAGDRSEMEADLQRIHRACSSAQELMDQLVAFSGRQVFLPRRLQLSLWLEEVQPVLAAALGPTASLALSSSASDLTVNADPRLVSHCLCLLLHNARQAQSHRVTIEALSQRVSSLRGFPELAPGEYALLRVSDDGEGVPLSVLERALVPFESTRRGGNGMGLPVVLGIMQQHQGAVVIDSVPGQRTSVTLYLPRVGSPTATKDDKERTRTVPLRTLLVVDDQRLVRNSIRRVLQPLGYRILEAGSGGEATEAFSQHGNSIDLMISDVVLPDVNGFDLARSMSERTPGLKVLLMSGCAHSPQEPVPKSSFIEKPFSTEELARAVRAALDS